MLTEGKGRIRILLPIWQTPIKQVPFLFLQIPMMVGAWCWDEEWNKRHSVIKSQSIKCQGSTQVFASLQGKYQPVEQPSILSLSKLAIATPIKHFISCPDLKARDNTFIAKTCERVFVVHLSLNSLSKLAITTAQHKASYHMSLH